jgi:hypothetical protein
MNAYVLDTLSQLLEDLASHQDPPVWLLSQTKKGSLKYEGK